MPIPFSSKDHNKINLVNIANSSTIINNTITSSDIADSSIINNNFANGSITSDKLSTALQNILVDFDDRLTALEEPSTPPPSGGWSGTITFVKLQGGGSQQFISVKTEAGFIATDYIYNTGSNVISVSLASLSSYVYISMYGNGSWDITNNSFQQNVGEPSYTTENNRLWERYTIPESFIGENLTYNFETYYND